MYVLCGATQSEQRNATTRLRMVYHNSRPPADGGSVSSHCAGLLKAALFAALLVGAAMAVVAVGGGMGILILCFCFPLLGKVVEFVLFTPGSSKEEKIKADKLKRKEEARRERARDSKLVRSQSGRCKVLNSAVVRTGSSFVSPICGQLNQGTVFSVLEAVRLEATVRVRLEHGKIAGWTSIVARSGTRLLEVTDDELAPPLADSTLEME